MKRWLIPLVLGMSILSAGCVNHYRNDYRYRDGYRYRYNDDHRHDRDDYRYYR